MFMMDAWSGSGFVRNVSALGDAALKTGSCASPIEMLICTRKLRLTPDWYDWEAAGFSYVPEVKARTA
ncbi:hypothetical protein PSCICO_48210 [Pseudomonas cichorii]|nr:hypothetical protein PSCICO_48210 [Pseudomonas cichorii]